MASANAQEAKTVSGKIRCSETSELILPEGVKYSMRDMGGRKMLTPVRPRKAAADAEMVTVNLKVTSSRKPTSGAIFNKDLMENIDFNGKEGSIKVPKGTYDFYVDFIGDSYYYVFKENVEVTDGMVLEFDQNEATYPVEFHYFDENNQELFMDVYSGSKLDTKGTANDMTKFTAIINKDFGQTAFSLSQGYMPKGHPEEFYINKLSDKYYIGQATNIGVKSHYYCYKAVISDVEQKVYNSEPANLARLETGFNSSPVMKDDQKKDLPGVETTFLNDGKLLASIRAWFHKDSNDNGKVITFIDCPESTAGDEYRMNVTARPVVSDYYEMVDDNYGEYEDFAFIVAPQAIGNSKEGIRYLVAGSDMDMGLNVPVGETYSRFYPGHPDFSFSSPDGTAYFGNSVPVLIYRSMKMLLGGEYYAFDSFRYMGRYGEMRETDAKIAEKDSKQEYYGNTVTITNSNIEVDGIAGKNVAEIKFDYMKDDNNAPSFQMLSFRDADGNICDRFLSTQGARMIAAGGDFSYIDNDQPPYIGHFICEAPASVKAYYAPHGTETWTELAMVEDPAKYFMPAFGHFYEADLSGVIADTKDAWFDVRLEMADAAGNYQKQTISPAFKTNATSSVSLATNESLGALVVYGKTVRLSNEKVADFTVRSIDGRTLLTAHACYISLDSMGQGMYIVTAKTANDNTVSTKVAL